MLNSRQKHVCTPTRALRVLLDFCSSGGVAEHDQPVPRHAAQQGHTVGSQVQAPYPIFPPLSVYARMGQKGLEVQVVCTNPRGPSLPRAVDRNESATEDFKQDPLESRGPHRMRQVRLQFPSVLLSRLSRILILIPESLGRFYVSPFCV